MGMTWWFLLPWSVSVILVVVYGFRRRASMSPYWWEPLDMSRLANTILALVTLIVMGVIVYPQTPSSLRLLLGGLVAAVCVPAIILGIWYRLELKEQGLEPRYKQERRTSH